MSNAEIEASSIASDLRQVTTDHALTLTTSWNSWQSPLPVEAVDDVECWDVPFGDDWLVRELSLAGGHGAEYILAFNSAGDPPAQLFATTEEGDRGRSRGIVEDLELVDSAEEFTCGDCDEPFESQAQLNGHLANPHTDCERALDDDQEEEADDKENDDEDGPVYPDGVTSADLQAAVDEHAYLSEVADALDLTKGRARSLLFAEDLYGDVIEGRDRCGGGRR